MAITDFPGQRWLLDLRDGLAGFISDCLQDVDPNTQRPWWDAVDTNRESRQLRKLPRNPASWNPDEALLTLVNNWGAFQYKTKLRFTNPRNTRPADHTARGWVNRIYELRNAIMHQDVGVSNDDLVDFLRNAELLLIAVGNDDVAKVMQGQRATIQRNIFITDRTTNKTDSPVSAEHDFPSTEIGKNTDETTDVLTDNPKPYATGKYLCLDFYRITGNDTSPLILRPRYTHKYLEIPEEIKPYYTSFIKETRSKSPKFWNGPTCRLARCEENSTPNEDTRILTLHLTPIGWFDFTALNTFLDFRLPTGETIGGKFAPRGRVSENSSDLEWCQLSNLLSLAIMPITTDGFGIVQFRDRRGVSSDGDRWTSGVAENIHRYWDEAARGPQMVGTFARRTHPLLSRGERLGFRLTRRYSPEGIPHPLLTAQRGVHEELSEALAKDIPLDRYHFMSLGWSYATALPTLIVVVETGKTSAEIKNYVATSPGIDHSEFKNLEYLRLDSNNERTAEVLAFPSKWVAAGLAAFMTAINYAKSRGIT